MYVLSPAAEGNERVNKRFSKVFIGWSCHGICIFIRWVGVFSKFFRFFFFILHEHGIILVLALGTGEKVRMEMMVVMRGEN